MKYLGKITDNKDLVTKEYVDKAGIVYYGVCDTAADTQVKEVTISGITELFTGLHVRIYFRYAMSGSSTIQLKINNLTAVDIYRTNASEISVYEWASGTVIDMVYNGSYFLVIKGGHASTTYYGVTKLSSAVDSTATDLAATPSAVKSAYDLANAALPGSALVTSVDSSSTDSQVPSAKLLYDTAETKQPKIFIRTILAPTSGWTGTGPYSFSLATANIYYTPTIHTKADVDAPSESITKMISDGIKAMYIENDNGNLSLISVGAVPSTPIELQVGIYEVAPIPIITAQASQSHYDVGDTILLSVTPTSEDYTYQWQYSTNGGAGWSNGSSTSDTFSWTAGTQQNGRWYRCRVANSYGSAVSNVLVLSIG